MSRMDIGVLSGTVMTVGGPIPVHDLGVTMMHEHIVVDVISWWHCPRRCRVIGFGICWPMKSAWGRQLRPV